MGREMFEVCVTIIRSFEELESSHYGAMRLSRHGVGHCFSFFCQVSLPGTRMGGLGEMVEFESGHLKAWGDFGLI